jgi:hypothetical protein
MNKEEFRAKMNELIAIGKQYKWQLLGADSKNYRVTLQDDLGIFRMDIYVSTWSVVFGRKGQAATTSKKHTIESITDILKNPYK